MGIVELFEYLFDLVLDWFIGCKLCVWSNVKMTFLGGYVFLFLILILNLWHF